MKRILIVVALALAGCSHTSVIPMSQDTVQINTTASLDCGPDGAQRVAFKQAAAETIRRGYDRFIIQQSQGATDVTVNYIGLRPVVGQEKNQALIAKMFKEGEAGGKGALSARDALGPEWQKITSSDTTRMACTY